MARQWIISEWYHAPIEPPDGDSRTVAVTGGGCVIEKIKKPVEVAVAGATGMVGQRLVRALDQHPWFHLAEVAASEKNCGRPYGEACEWKLGGEIPAAASRMILKRIDPASLQSPLIFSALDAAIALEAEENLAAEGRVVVSNAASHRLDPDVPLVVPEINPQHLQLTEGQRQRRKGKGFIACNPNCSVIGLALALAPLARLAALRRIVVTTLQAVSGAGYPGVPSLDLIDNVIPWIGGEQDKIEREPVKIFGEATTQGIVPAELTVSAQVHRVGVTDGHLLSIAVATDPALGVEDVKQAIISFRGEPQERGLPSATDPVLILHDAPSRPQPRLDRDAGGGMAVSIGQVRLCPVLGLRMEALSHNTLRGAALGTLLLGELIFARGLLP